MTVFRLLRDEDIFPLQWWYNWYITHNQHSFEENIPITSKTFTTNIKDIKEKYPIIVYVDEDPVGCAYLYDGQDYSAYVRVLVAYDKIGQRYGSRLVREIERIAKADGYRELKAEIIEGNEIAEIMFKSLGFTKTDIYREIEKSSGPKKVYTYVRELVGYQDVDTPINVDPYQKSKRVPID